ncbi:hypothetical protein DUNSADRAFT_451 [Dunaliella salina]|uniref:Mut7-C RNAse domain-containing protein n=1 Tax=Dunaliella salina TaxID=3046 RepID=A0ABQ7GYA2_DUNSA|nr:hypothetical protein DUNSADRAFT_451 [Dunaliella salina]|eukprot:KAF5839576.1 hypothetical protein DUNSADRAFT_451 [Dunaliella salina]
MHFSSMTRKGLATGLPAGDVAACFSHPKKVNHQNICNRCSNCNAAQFMLLSREEAATMVPPKVFQIVDEFYKCGACSKTFWMGPKSYSAVNMLEGVLGQQELQHSPTQLGRDSADF